MPVKESGGWFVYLAAAAIIGLVAAAYHYGWLDGLTGWFNQTLGI